MSYRQHFGTLIEKADGNLASFVPAGSTRSSLALAKAIIWPQGLMIRSSQIVGSFVLLNGISHLLDIRMWKSAQPAVPK